MSARMSCPVLRRAVVVMAALGLSLAFAGPASAQTPTALGGAAPLADIDARQALLDLSLESGDDTAAPSPRQEAAVEALREQAPGLTLRINPVTGTPSRVYSTASMLTGPSDADAATIVADFLGAQSDLYEANTDDVAALALVRDARGAAGPDLGLESAQSPATRLALDQRFLGRQVYPATLVGLVTGDGELLSLAGEIVPQLANAISAEAPVLSAAAAVRIAAGSLGVEVGAEPNDDLNASGVDQIVPPTGPEQRSRFAPGDVFNAEVSTRLIYFVVARTDVRLVWEVVAGAAGNPFIYQLFVDATDGAVLRRLSVTSTGAPVWQTFTKVNGTAATTDLHPHDSPAPLSPGPGEPDGSLPPPVSAAMVQTNGDAEASPGGWIDDETMITAGNNAIASAGRSRFDPQTDDFIPEADLRDVDGEETRVFAFPLDLSDDPTATDNVAAITTNAFFVVNWWHDRLHALGFDEAAGNFQFDNFDRGGGDGDPILVNVIIDPAFPNNAFFATPPADGTCCPLASLMLFDGPNPDRSTALDHQILLHELTHGLTNRLIGGPNVAGLRGTDQAKALGEGYSDWYAMTLLAEEGDDLDGTHGVGAWATHQFVDNYVDSYFFGIRRFPYTTDLDASPMTLADIDPRQFDFDDAVAAVSPVFASIVDDLGDLGLFADSPHAAGEIWAASLWEVRTNLVREHGFATGNELALQLVTDSLFLLRENPTYVDARDAVLLADLNLSGGNNHAAIWQGFAKRGLGVRAEAPDNGGMKGIIENFTPGGAL